METCFIPPEGDVRVQLERILAASPFANSIRSQRFLRYVVEHSLREEDEPIKEYAIALEAFDRDPSYDPSVDATVRVEAGRLRSRLRDYYADAGRNDPLLIEIPRGSYRAVFSQRVAHALPEKANARPEPPPVQSELPPRRERRPLLWGATAALLVLVLVLGMDKFQRDRQAGHARRSDAPIVLAVLPFSNQTGSDKNNYLTDGITDNLIRLFSELPRLRVVSRAAIDRTDRKNIVSRLGATELLTGELQRNSEGHLILNSELSNAADGTVIRSSQYLPDEADLRTVQADMVRDVIGGLGMELQSRESAAALRPITSSPVAFQEFLRGEGALQKGGNESDLLEAISLFQDAVKKDPSFAQALATTAEAQAAIAVYFGPPLPYFEQARQSATRAIALDPAIPDAHGVLGLIHLLFDWDIAGAQSELSQVDRRVDAIWHFGCTAHLLERTGNKRHAEEDLERMLEFNPNSPSLIAELGCVNYYAGRYEDSIRYYRQSLAAEPRSVIANCGLGRSLGREGKYTEALDLLQGFNSAYGVEHPLIDAEIGYIQALAGDRKGARAMIQRLQAMSRKRFVDPYFTAIIYLALKDENQTYAWLDKAYDIRSPFLISIATDPKWSGSQGDPRFQALWDRMMRASSAPTTVASN
jgi:TolB-like protein